MAMDSLSPSPTSFPNNIDSFTFIQIPDCTSITDLAFHLPPTATIFNDHINHQTTRHILFVQETLTYRRIAQILPNPTNDVFAVDIGSAYGHTTSILSTSMGTPQNVLGLDISSKFVTKSKATYPTLRFERIDVLEDTSFLIISFWTYPQMHFSLLM